MAAYGSAYVASLTRAPLPNEDVAAYVSDAAAAAPYRFKARLTIHAPASAVRERLSPIAGRIEDVDGERCIVHTGAHTLDGLAFHLGFLGFEFEVHEPNELIDHLRAFSARLRRAASASKRHTEPTGRAGSWPRPFR